jgi:hypothetical protein
MVPLSDLLTNCFIYRSCDKDNNDGVYLPKTTEQYCVVSGGQSYCYFFTKLRNYLLF